MTYEDTAVLLLSHGSTLPYAEEVFKKICAKFKAKTEFDAEVGYMKVARPNLPEAINILKERNPNLKRIIATPVTLTYQSYLVLNLRKQIQDNRMESILKDIIYTALKRLISMEKLTY